MAAWSAYSSASPPAPSTFATTRNGSHDSRPSRSRCPSPLREDRYIGGPVINVFDNLLPDSEPIRRRVAERVGATGMDAYSMLSALGHDCVEALQFLPEGIIRDRRARLKISSSVTMKSRISFKIWLRLVVISSSATKTSLPCNHSERRLRLFGSATAWIVAAPAVRLATSVARSSRRLLRRRSTGCAGGGGCRGAGGGSWS